MKPIIYTANINGKDEPKVLTWADESKFDFIYFTDNPDLKVPKPWRKQIIQNTFTDPVYTARLCKLQPHNVLPEHKQHIWMDANFDLLSDPSELIEEGLNDYDLLFVIHPERSCMYDELNICTLRMLDNPDTMKNQLKRYEDSGFPKNFGLVETGIQVRNNCESVRNFLNFWFTEVLNGSRRDQLSVMYALWKNSNLNYYIMPRSGIHNFELLHHKRALNKLC